MKFNELAIESIAYELPPVAVSTEQLVRRLDPVLRRFKIPVDAMLQLMTQSLQRMEVMELDIRGLQTENRRILDILQHRYTEGE